MSDSPIYDKTCIALDIYPTLGDRMRLVEPRVPPYIFTEPLKERYKGSQITSKWLRERSNEQGLHLDPGKPKFVITKEMIEPQQTDFLQEVQGQYLRAIEDRYRAEEIQLATSEDAESTQTRDDIEELNRESPNE